MKSFGAAVLFSFCLLGLGWMCPDAVAQSIRIQSSRSLGYYPSSGISIQINGRQGHRFGYPALGIQTFGYPVIGFPSIIAPYGYAYPYGDYGYRSDYYDYRADYYNRIYDSYRRELYSDSLYGLPSYNYGPTVSPSSSYRDYIQPGYQPPVARIEPFGEDLELGVPFVERSRPLLTTANLPESLRAAATRLSAGLSRRGADGDVWLDYLAPGRIIAAIDQGLPASEFGELMRNYDGILGNPSLANVSRTDGFAETRSLLREWISMSDVPVVPPVPAESDLAPEEEPGGDANTQPTPSVQQPVSQTTERASL